MGDDPAVDNGLLSKNGVGFHFELQFLFTRSFDSRVRSVLMLRMLYQEIKHVHSYSLITVHARSET